VRSTSLVSGNRFQHIGSIPKTNTHFRTLDCSSNGVSCDWADISYVEYDFTNSGNNDGWMVGLGTHEMLVMLRTRDDKIWVQWQNTTCALTAGVHR